MVQLGGFDQRVDQVFDVCGPLDLAEVVGQAARHRQLRGEELAAVLVGQDRDLVGPELLRDLEAYWWATSPQQRDTTER